MEQQERNDPLIFFVNGTRIVDPEARPEVTLLTYLRHNLGLTGSKLVCGEGGCGACTVMVSSFENGRIKHYSLNACLAPVVSVHGKAVTTVEGIGSTRSKLHEIQKRLTEYHGSQCGFCTPGIIMSMYTLLRNDPKPSMESLEENLQGNLCRCTGYRPILDCFRTFTIDGEVTNGMDSKSFVNEKCNGMTNGICCKDIGNNRNDTEDEYNGLIHKRTNLSPLDHTQEPIFPQELRTQPQKSLQFKSKKMVWIKPSSLNELLELKNQHPESKIVVGNTELGIEMKFGKFVYPLLLDPTNVPELRTIQIKTEGIEIGSASTLEDINDCLKQAVLDYEPCKTRIFIETIEMLKWFASKQIRNVGSIAGNIMTGSPISDLNPILIAAGCLLIFKSKNQEGSRHLELNEKFYTSYRKNLARKDEVLISILIPFSSENEFFTSYKQSRRRDDDIAIVNSAFYFKFDGDILSHVRIAYGGVAPVTFVPSKTIQTLIGKKWCRKTIESTFESIIKEVNMQGGAPGGMERYRQTLLIAFLYKAFLKVSCERKLPIDIREISATNKFHKPPYSSNQIVDIPIGKNEFKSVGLPIKHVFAEKQVCGEAIYVDDMPEYKNQVYAAFVLSKKARAKLINIDTTHCSSVHGYIRFLSSDDVPRNTFRISSIEDEYVFAKNDVHHVGQIIGMVLGDTLEAAKEASNLVKVQYEEYKPILTIEDAIINESFYELKREISKGDVDKAYQNCDHIIEGESSTGAQEHFYLEPNVGIATFEEEGEVRIYTTTQNPTETQAVIARVLNYPMSKVHCIAKRLGGGFGGKETRNIPFSVAAAVAAKELKRPVKFILDRDEDMMLTGHRHSSLIKYKAGFDKTGLIKFVDLELYLNAGCTIDLSIGVLDRAFLHCDNTYHYANFRGKGICCKTNIASNTAFRGFGSPQGMMGAEFIIDSISEVLNLDPCKIRELNFYKENSFTFFGQPLLNCSIERCWQECLTMSHYEEEQRGIHIFNSKNKWKKRGLSIVPTKFGIAFGVPHLNQGGCLIHIYTDGSVLISSGGVEMGQGLSTKMIQIASQVLGTSYEKISIIETSTDKVPNSSPTAASLGSDLYGAAVLEACNSLNSRLEPIKKVNHNLSWEELIRKAYLERICLSATGFHKVPNLSMDWVNGVGSPYSYFTYGVGCSVVELDILTGDNTILKTNIVMDLGESLNPAIDIGQIEGGFMQGYGLFVMEQLLHTPDGALITKGPSTYKIPSFGDIPSEFQVSLLRGSSNPRAVFSSKAVGEPPLFLAASVYFAIREAIKSSRTENGLTNNFKLDIPATPDKIRMLCNDQFTDLVPDLNTNKKWAIQI